MPKIGSNYICVTVILIDFILKNDDKYRPQIFLKECKYIEKGKGRLDILLMTEVCSEDSETKIKK